MMFEHKGIKKAFFMDLLRVQGHDTEDVSSVSYSYLESLGINSAAVMDQVNNRLRFLLEAGNSESLDEVTCFKLCALLVRLRELIQPTMQNSDARCVDAYLGIKNFRYPDNWEHFAGKFRPSGIMGQFFTEYQVYDTQRFLRQNFFYADKFPNEDTEVSNIVNACLEDYNVWCIEVDSFPHYKEYAVSQLLKRKSSANA